MVPDSCGGLWCTDAAERELYYVALGEWSAALAGNKDFSIEPFIVCGPTDAFVGVLAGAVAGREVVWVSTREGHHTQFEAVTRKVLSRYDVQGTVTCTCTGGIGTQLIVGCQTDDGQSLQRG